MAIFWCYEKEEKLADCIQYKNYKKSNSIFQGEEILKEIGMRQI